jgi:hypothetical protein
MEFAHSPGGGRYYVVNYALRDGIRAAIGSE